MRSNWSRLEAAGGQAAAVTMGTPAENAAFKQKFELPFPLLSDPQRKVYAAFGLGRGGVLQIGGPSVWGAGLKALWRGGLGVPRGDVRQMPGDFVIDTGGIIRFAHYAATTSDQPDLDAMIAALQGPK